MPLTPEEKADRIGKLLCHSRKDAGKTQEFMAKAIGVSKKTIQNWEKGVTFPDLFQCIEWFSCIKLNPLSYYLAFQYPWLSNESFSSDSSYSDSMDEIILQLLKRFTDNEKKQMFYILSGHHGSPWYNLLQMLTAHCHTSMKSRVAAARIILENYEMEQKTGHLVCPDQIMPDISVLRHAIDQGKKAAENNEHGYTSL